MRQELVWFSYMNPLETFIQNVDKFLEILNTFRTQNPQYREEIKNFVKTVNDFKDMFCFRNTGRNSSNHEQRQTIPSHVEDVRETNEEIAKLKKLLAEKDEEIKLEKTKTSQYNEQLQQSQQEMAVELQRRQNRIAELKNNLGQEKRKTQQLSHEVENLKMKNSALMSAQEEFGVESKDKCLPGKIASMCKTLFREQYSDARYYLQRKNHKDSDIYNILAKMFVEANRWTKKAVEEGKFATREAIFEALSMKHFQKNKDNNLPKELEKEIYRRLRQYPSQEEQRFLTQELMKHFNYHDKNIGSYMIECVRITWLMNASYPPMYASFDDVKVSSDRHEVRDGRREQEIVYWISPCIYFSEEAYRRSEEVLVMGRVVSD